MDNLAHTLVGAALGRVVAGQKVPAAGWIGAVAANAPDWSELFLGFRPFRESLAYYTMHRGITHSFLGAAVETLAVTVVLWAWFALLQRRGALPPVPLGVLTALVAATVWSHVYMDWQGSYGVRPFLPWSHRWYYGDWVAIVDPLFWLIPLVGLAWGAERHWRDLTPLILVTAFVLWLEFFGRPGLTAGWLRAVSLCMAGLGAVGWLYHWFGVAGRRRAAALSLALLGVYAGAQAAASGPAKAAARQAAVRRFGPSATWAALTRVGTPFQWEPIYASPDSVAGRGWALPRHLDDPRVQVAVRETVGGRALGGFARFLTAQVQPEAGSVAVVLRDARYARPPAMGWGVVTVALPVAR